MNHVRHVFHRVGACVALVGPSLWIHGCEQPATQVIVALDAQPLSRERAFTLRVSVRGAGMDEPFELDRTLVGSPAEATLPVSVPLVPEQGDDSVTFDFTGQLLDEDGQCFSERKLRGVGFVEHQLVEIPLVFSDACINIKCGDGFDCVEGECVPVGSGAMPTALPPGGCRRGLCFEHPFPAGDLVDACLFERGEGYVAGRFVLATLTDGGWGDLEVEPVGDARDVSCWARDAVVVVGNGFIKTLANGSWTDTPTAAVMNAVWGESLDTAWAVGTEGAVYRRQGDTWLEVPWSDIVPGVDPPDFRTVWGVGDEIYLGSFSGIHRFDGSTWTSLPPPDGDMDTRAYAIGGTALDDWFLRYNTLLYRYDGTGFVSVGAGHAGLYPDIAATPSGGVLIEDQWRAPNTTSFVTTDPYHHGGGARGAGAFEGQFAQVTRLGVGLFDEDGWTELVERLSSVTLIDIAAHPSNPVYALAVGRRGTILKRIGPLDRPQWKRAVTPSDEDLTAVCLGDELAVAVGGGGAVFESRDGDVFVNAATPVSDDLLACHADRGRFVAASASTLLVRDDGWNALTIDGLDGGTVTAVAWGADGAIYVGVQDEVGLASGCVGGDVAPDGRILRRSAEGVWSAVGDPLCEPVTVMVADGGVVWSASGNEVARVTSDGYALTPIPATQTSDRILDFVADADGPVAVLAGTTEGTHTLRARDRDFANLWYAELRSVARTPGGDLLGAGIEGRVLIVQPAE